MMEAFYLLGVKIQPYAMCNITEALSRCLRDRKPAFIVTANTEIIMSCQKDQKFREIVNAADFVLPDGIGIVWAGRHLGHRVPERVAGFDLMRELFKLADQARYRIFFFGGAPGVAAAAIENCRGKYPAAIFAGCCDGFFSENETSGIIEKINQAKADILLVALGSPKQERWIFAHREKLNNIISVGVGGAFDVMAGKAVRAPRFMQKAGLEWLFRLYKQPSRFWRMLAIPRFIFWVLFNKKKIRQRSTLVL
jgi:N-acetylglucosaminyldiphosphoundecaprenol N-acetyl-beta-D-mannosaminyltransferase